MKRIRMKKIIFWLMCCFAIQSVAQQDPQYNLYMFNQLAINPAYAGSKDALSTTLLVRQQWASFIGAPRTSVVSIHAPLRKKFIGLGGYLYSDVIGPKQISGAYGTYSFRMKLGSGTFSLGLGTGIVNYNFNWSQIQFKDQGDVSSYYQTTNKAIFDFTAGAYYQTNSFYTGLGVTHLNGATIFEHNPQDTADFLADYKLRMHTFFTIGKGFKAGDNVIVNPSLVIKYYGNGIPSADINVNVNLKKKVWFGASIRSGYGLVLLTQYNITEKFRVGYSLDIGNNRIGRVGGLSHEILLGYNFNIYHSKIVSPRFL